MGPKLKVHGLQGLRVADASIMPNLISGNTQVACYTIGEKASDLILEERFYSKYDKTQAWCNLQVSEFQIGKMIQRSNLVHFFYWLAVKKVVQVTSKWFMKVEVYLVLGFRAGSLKSGLEK